MRKEVKPLCENCGLTFSNQQYLRIHVQTIHEKLREFKCHHCEKSFSVKFSLNRHIAQVHTKQKKYSCRYCSLAFSDYTTRHKHERAVHQQTRPYKCMCGKAFSYSNVLKNHMKTHLTEKKYSCDHCSQEFSHKHNLLTHVKNMHLREDPDSKPMDPIFVETKPPLPAFVPQILNISGFKLITPNQILNMMKDPSISNEQPLKVIFANI